MREKIIAPSQKFRSSDGHAIRRAYPRAGIAGTARVVFSPILSGDLLRLKLAPDRRIRDTRGKKSRSGPHGSSSPNVKLQINMLKKLDKPLLPGSPFVATITVTKVMMTLVAASPPIWLEEKMEFQNHTPAEPESFQPAADIRPSNRSVLNLATRQARDAAIPATSL